MGDESRGIYRKYRIERTDGSSGPGEKHEHCTYFVIDLQHDPYAVPALKAYAQACRKTNPKLASDLLQVANAHPPPRPTCGCREAHCPHTPTFWPGDTPNEVMDVKLQIADAFSGRR